MYLNIQVNVEEVYSMLPLWILKMHFNLQKEKHVCSPMWTTCQPVKMLTMIQSIPSSLSVCIHGTVVLPHISIALLD